MLDATYRIGRLLLSRGWIVGLSLIALTIGFGTSGFLGEGRALSFGDALYHAIGLLAIETGDVAASGNWHLELARWLGMLFWASALITLVIQFFREAVHRLLVTLLARDHVLIGGLGQHGGRLVEALRAQGRTVVVIEPNRAHPAAEQCRRLGAVVLFGQPDHTETLLAANLPRASALLALFLDERDCVRIATTAYRVLHSEKATPRKPPVRCVLRLTEPGLLDVIRRHKIKTDRTDRIQLEILNSHEITATTMVREARANSRRGSLRKLLVLGLGTHHRLGEMVVLRAVKDHLIQHDGQVAEPLDIHVYDQQSSEWLETFRGRHPFVDRVAAITPHPCWARKVGANQFDHDHDAAFVCIPDEGHATAQAVMLRREVLTEGQPIMVRVPHSRSGYGELIGDPASGWGENLHAVGLEDPLFDPDTATRPETELRAQTIHHDYRARQTNRDEPANRPWADLDETFREANRKLAERYAAHLVSTDGTRKIRRYRWEFQPHGFTRVNPPDGLLFRFSAEELESLAAREHQLWKEERERAGWSHGPVKDVQKKTNPLLVDFSKLTDEAARAYNRDFIESIPRILALADYTIVPDEPSE
jgi:voltage-gated potassium channel Kch